MTVLDFNEIDNSKDYALTRLNEVIEEYDSDGTFREEDVIEVLRDAASALGRD